MAEVSQKELEIYIEGKECADFEHRKSKSNMDSGILNEVRQKQAESDYNGGDVTWTKNRHRETLVVLRSQ